MAGQELIISPNQNRNQVSSNANRNQVSSNANQNIGTRQCDDSKELSLKDLRLYLMDKIKTDRAVTNIRLDGIKEKMDELSSTTTNSRDEVGKMVATHESFKMAVEAENGLIRDKITANSASAAKEIQKMEQAFIQLANDFDTVDGKVNKNATEISTLRGNINAAFSKFKESFEDLHGKINFSLEKLAYLESMISKKEALPAGLDKPAPALSVPNLPAQVKSTEESGKESKKAGEKPDAPQNHYADELEAVRIAKWSGKNRGGVSAKGNFRNALKGFKEHIDFSLSKFAINHAHRFNVYKYTGMAVAAYIGVVSPVFSGINALVKGGSMFGTLKLEYESLFTNVIDIASSIVTNPISFIITSAIGYALVKTYKFMRVEHANFKAGQGKE